jgi:23S rRNA pseudouridine1911/1915/1917 synthase
MRRLVLTVPEALDGCTVEQLMRRGLRLSKTKQKRAKFHPGGLLLDGQPVRSTAVARAGQQLTVTLPEREGSDILPVAGEVEILYEDSWLLVVNKPAGMSVHPGPGHYADTLGNRLAWRYQDEAFVLRLVNRLDKGTSGLLLAAKSAEAHEALMGLLHTDRFVRSYLALCEGAPPEEAGTVTLPIGKRAGTLNEYEVRPDGLPSQTDYRILERQAEGCLLSLTLHTGRTHQIRVHMAALGCPLLGDPVYGHGGPPGHPALHSYQVQLTHPFTGEALVWRCPPPPDWAALLPEGWVLPQ